jgi:hypothetical protein
MPQEPVPVTGVWLQKATAHNGSQLRVLVEVEGEWHEAITEVAHEGPISHTVHPSGILLAPVVEF